MRDILFRGKRTDNKQWVEGYYVLIGDVNANPYILRNNGKETNLIRVAHSTVGQYTGLTDKNGTKIFEGDIVAAEIEGGAYDQFVFPVGVVVFENGAFGRKDKKHFTPFASYAPRVVFEVIGNIHENPELLKRGNDEW